MDFKNVFKFIIEKFNAQKIDFALIGGFALQAVGLTRTTRDIDMLIVAQDSSTIKDIMLSYGYHLLHESKDVLNFSSKKYELGRVDFLLAHRTYALNMLKNAKESTIINGKFKIKVIAVEDLIGLKVQSSSNDPERKNQDMADIEKLIEMHYRSLNISLVKEYFDLFERGYEFSQLVEKYKNVK